jgi:PAS domain S-box-containing protein
MESTENVQLETIKKFCDSVPDPFVVFDNNRVISYYNHKAGIFLKAGSDTGSLHELFTATSQQKLDKLIDEAGRFHKVIREVTTLELADTTIIKGELTLTEILVGVQTRYFTLAFSNTYYWANDNLATRVTVRQDELERIVANPKILQIIDDIKSSYPFTFLGKNKIQQEVNKLEEYFWIKDVNDYIVLSNRKYAGAYGLKTTQLEGKSEKTFLPAYYLDFYRSIEAYIKETLNALVIEGVPFRGFASWQDYETIEIPLSDAENNVLALIGISQKKNKIAQAGSQREKQLFENLNLPMALFDFNENLIIASSTLKDYNELLDWGQATLIDVFGESRISEIHEFIENTSVSSITLPDFAFESDESSLFSCILDKTAAKAGVQNFIIATFLPQNKLTNFEDLIKYKGKMFDLLVRFNPEPIFIYDTENLRFLEVNDAALALYGYRREEFLQLDLTDLYTPEDIQSLLDSAPARDSVPVFHGPFKHRKKDGSNIHVKIAKSSFDFEGHEAHFNLIHNVSEQEQSTLDTVLFHSLLENTYDLVLTTDSVGFILEANSAAVEFLGKSEDELVRSSLLEFVADESRGELNTKIFFSGENRVIMLSAKFKNKMGLEIPVSVKALPAFRDNNSNETYLLIIHPEPQAKEIVKEVPVEVIREVVKEVPVERPASIAPSTNAGSPVGLELSQISMMFHEILTPINVMLGFIQEIKDGMEQPTVEQKEALDYINQNRDNLLNIMNSVSEYAQVRTKSAELIPDEVQFSELFESVLKEERETFEHLKKHPAAGKISSSLSFYSDKDKFKSLLGLFTRIVLHISDEPQVYISANQVDDFSFAVLVRDDFSKVTDKLQSNFEAFLSGKSNQSPKIFNLSRYNFMALNTLIELLHGVYHTSSRSGKTYEIGFTFPMNLFEERSEESAIMNFDEVEVPQSAPFEEPFAPVTASAYTNTFHESEPDSFRFEEEFPAQQHEAVHVPEQVHAHEEEDIVVPSNANFSFQSPVTAKDTAHSKYESISDNFTFESSGFAAEEPEVEPEPEPVKAAPANPRVTAAPLPEIHAEPRKAFELSELKCLYIEDQVDSQILFKVQMKELQEIKFAVSFEEALPILTTQTFDFIVMDINLQGEYNGLDALKMIHQMPGFTELPIIAVTAYVLPGDKEKFIAAGFNDFISKPIFREKLIESLEKIFLKK